MRTTISIIAIFLLYISSNAQPFTAAELSNYTSTMTNAEVKAYIAELRPCPQKERISVWESAGGRISTLRDGQSQPSNPGNRPQQAVVVYVQANIHAERLRVKRPC